MTKEKKQVLSFKIDNIYWVLPMVLFLIQALFTFNSFNQIRYEELAEGIRNPFWIQNGYMYDGISSNVGWYGMLAFFYGSFGFSLFSAKLIRLALALISLYCLAAFLRKYLSPSLAWLPLLVIGLSPTLLFFNTLQTSYGTDLQYLPICLFLLSQIDFKKFHQSLISQVGFWFLAMFGCLSYPTFIFYMPSLTIYYFYLFFNLKKEKKPSFYLGNILVSLTAFLAPLLFAFIYIKNSEVLIYDYITKSGLFRGAGILQFDADLFSRNLGFLISNLFNSASGYYYEVASVEFSWLLPAISLVLLFFLSFRLIVLKKGRFFIGLVLLVLFLSLIFVSFSADFTPGLRRYTPVLASIYGLFVICWYWINKSSGKLKALKKLKIWIFPILLVHNLLVLPLNLEGMKNLSGYRDTEWFMQARSPEESLKIFTDRVVKEDLNWACLNEKKQYSQCRYSEIYAAVAGYCLWNRLVCHSISGYDPKTEKFIPLDPELWSTYYFGH